MIELLEFVRATCDWRSQSGQTLAEYSILLAVVAVGVVTLALFVFTSSVVGLYDTVTACFGGVC